MASSNTSCSRRLIRRYGLGCSPCLHWTWWASATPVASQLEDILFPSKTEDSPPASGHWYASSPDENKSKAAIPYRDRRGRSFGKRSHTAGSGCSETFGILGHILHIRSRTARRVVPQTRCHEPYSWLLTYKFPSSQHHALHIGPSSLHLLLQGKLQSIGRTPGHMHSTLECRFHIGSRPFRSPSGMWASSPTSQPAHFVPHMKEISL